MLDFKISTAINNLKNDNKSYLSKQQIDEYKQIDVTKEDEIADKLSIASKDYYVENGDDVLELYNNYTEYLKEDQEFRALLAKTDKAIKQYKIEVKEAVKRSIEHKKEQQEKEKEIQDEKMENYREYKNRLQENDEKDEKVREKLEKIEEEKRIAMLFEDRE